MANHIKYRFENEIIKNTEIKLSMKSRNTNDRPEMLDHTRKYFKTQTNNVPTLGKEEAKEIQRSFKPNQKVLKKYKEFKNQNMVGGNNFTLGLNTKIPNDQSSSRNNFRSLPSKSSYNVSNLIQEYMNLII